MDLFDKCMPVIFRHEGGFQQIASDPGNWVGGYLTGKLVGTNYGIAAKFFPHIDIKNLTRDQARSIYRVHYWQPMKLEGICNELAVLHIFDMGINAGKGRAIRMSQHLAGVDPDGVMGPITRAAINNYKGYFPDEYANARRDYYRRLADKRPMMKGWLTVWLNRVNTTKFYEHPE